MEIIDLKKEKVIRIIKKTVKVLLQGGLIVYPTETCYGLGADAVNQTAVQKLLAFKGKRGKKAVSVAVADQKMARQYAVLSQTAKNLYNNFLPGPLTIISKSKGKVSPLLESVNKTLGIRIPDYLLTLKIIKSLGRPITATSANTSGKKPAYSLKDFIKYTAKKKLVLIDLFLDSGRLIYCSPSTVVDTTLNEFSIIRQGGIDISGKDGQTFISRSPKQTKKIAQNIFFSQQKWLYDLPLVFALQGELGAGKTQFCKGLGEALKIKSNIVSPTFILAREYAYQLDQVKAMFYHLDTWRMEKKKELLDLGFKKMLKPKNVIAIEWSKKVEPILNALLKQGKLKIIWVELIHLSFSKRKIKYQL